MRMQLFKENENKVFMALRKYLILLRNLAEDVLIVIV